MDKHDKRRLVFFLYAVFLLFAVLVVGSLLIPR